MTQEKLLGLTDLSYLEPTNLQPGLVPYLPNTDGATALFELNIGLRVPR